MKLPENTFKVKPDNMCDVCKEKPAPYYNITYYVHFCSFACFDDFIVGYNREIEEIARKMLKPDETTSLTRKERE